MTPIVLGPDGGEKVPRGRYFHRVLAEMDELEVVEMTFGPDFEGVDLHSHDDHADSFYVLEGEVEFTVGGETVRAGPGSFLGAEPGQTHGFRNPGPGVLRMLNLTTPNARFVQRMRER